MLKPIRTEKSLKEAASGKYTFTASPFTRKPEIKAWVEKAFGVNVTKVQTTIVHGKTYRAGRGGQKARHADFKKAIVTVKSGQKIDIYGA